MRKHVFTAMLLLLGFAASAQAQQSCVGQDRLSVQSAHTRPGSGGTYNYVARIANSSTQPIRFDVRFMMVNAQPNRDLFPTQTLNGRTYREFVLANGTTINDASRIAESIRLICR